MYEIKSISYEECRAEHFKALMKKMQRKIDWWQERKNKLRPLDMASRSHIECSKAGMQYRFYKDALEALEDNKFQYETGFVKGFEAAQPKWISVEDLPKNGCRCLILFEDGHCCDAEYDDCIDEECQFGEWEGIYDPCTLGYVDSVWRAYQEVTHWMPLPEPPKEEIC